MLAVLVVIRKAKQKTHNAEPLLAVPVKMTGSSRELGASTGVNN